MYIYFPWFYFHPSLDDLFYCLFVEAISLSLSILDACQVSLIWTLTYLSPLKLDLLLSFIHLEKVLGKEEAFVKSTHELQRLRIDHKLWSLKADAIDKTSKKASTDPEEQQTFLNSLALCREKYQLWR